MNFNELQLRLLQARAPEDVFPGVTNLADLKKSVRKMSAAVHPDANPTNTADAGTAFNRLSVWAERATAKMQSGSWGDGRLSASRTLTTERGEYEIHYLYRREALFDSLAATLNGDPVLFHVPRTPRYGNLVRQATLSLQALDGGSTPHWLDSHRLWDRVSYVTSRPADGLIPLEKVLAGYPGGMDLRQALNYVSGLLRVLTKVGRAKLVHGALNPATVMVKPGTDVCYIADWHYSVATGHLVEYVNDTYASLCPWEVREHKYTDAGTDLAAGMLLLQDMVAPSEISKDLLYLIRDHTVENRNRPSDIGKCYAALQESLKSATL